MSQHMNTNLFEVAQTTDDLCVESPTGSDGGYGHAYIGLKGNIAGAYELVEEGLYSVAERSDFVDNAVNVYIAKFGESLKREGAMDKFDPEVKAEILKRLGQSPK